MRDEPEHVRRHGRIAAALGEHIPPVLPPRQPPPLGGHRPRVEDRRAMDALVFVLRPGYHWHALQDPRLYARRAAASGALAVWAPGRTVSEAWQGLDWEWRAMDGAMTQAPLGGKRSAYLRPPGGRAVPNGACSPLVAGANRHDFKRVPETRTSLSVERPRPTPEPPQGRGLDTGDGPGGRHRPSGAAGSGGRLAQAGSRGRDRPPPLDG
jgi:putative transposase